MFVLNDPERHLAGKMALDFVAIHAASLFTFHAGRSGKTWVASLSGWPRKTLVTFLSIVTWISLQE